MYLSRISRVFWEETLYQRKGETKEDFLHESLKIQQLDFICNNLNEFLKMLSEKKDILLQKSSEYQLKKRNFTQTSFIENPQHRENIPSQFFIFDFSQISNDIEEIFSITKKIIQSLNFVSYLYEFFPLKFHIFRLPKNIQNDLINFKYKNLIKKDNPIILKQWIDEFFEVSLNENDCSYVSAKLDELNKLCPCIITDAEKEMITANMLIKFSEDKNNNEIAKTNMVDKAVEIMLKNPNNVRLEYVIKVLGDHNKIIEIIKICVLKGIYLKSLLDEDLLDNFKGLNVDQDESFNSYGIYKKKDFIYPKSDSINYITNKTDRFKFGPVNYNEPIISSNKRLMYSEFPSGNNLNSSYVSFGNIYDLNNLENNYNFCEYKKCVYTILKFLDEIYNSIKNHKKINLPGKKENFLLNVNDSFSEFLYSNIKEIVDKNSLEKKAEKNIFSFFKSFLCENKRNALKEPLTPYEIQEELISNLIKDIIYNKLWDFSLEDKIYLQNYLIEEILKQENQKFLHNLVFDHLKTKGMLEDIFKYKSPYIEEYLKLNALENQEYSDLKTSDSLINFYINDKNYEKAFEIVIKLCFQDNSKIDTENLEKNSVRLGKRLDYFRKAKYIVEKLIESKGDDDKRNFYANFKEKINKIISALNIQNEIKLNIKKIISFQKKNHPETDLAIHLQLIGDLEYNTYEIKELYYEYAYKFKLHEIKIMILFENFKIKNPSFLKRDEIKDMYNECFNFYMQKNQNYPINLLTLVKIIFL